MIRFNNSNKNGQSNQTKLNVINNNICEERLILKLELECVIRKSKIEKVEF